MMITFAATELARGRVPHSLGGWALVAALLAYYLLIRFLLVYAAHRRAGVPDPAHRIWQDIRHPPADGRRRTMSHFLAGRSVLLAGMLIMFPIALIPAKATRITILAIAFPVVVAAVAYADYRTSPRRTSARPT